MEPCSNGGREAVPNQYEVRATNSCRSRLRIEKGSILCLASRTSAYAMVSWGVHLVFSLYPSSSFALASASFSLFLSRSRWWWNSRFRRIESDKYCCRKSLATGILKVRTNFVSTFKSRFGAETRLDPRGPTIITALGFSEARSGQFRVQESVSQSEYWKWLSLPITY